MASSADGRRLVAVGEAGQIYTSSDFGATWSAHGITWDWAAVASSADGMHVIAMSPYGTSPTGSGGVFTSSDFGATWTEAEISYPGLGTPSWSAVALPADGLRLAAAR